MKTWYVTSGYIKEAELKEYQGNYSTYWTLSIVDSCTFDSRNCNFDKFTRETFDEAKILQAEMINKEIKKAESETLKLQERIKILQATVPGEAVTTFNSFRKTELLKELAQIEAQETFKN